MHAKTSNTLSDRNRLVHYDPISVWCQSSGGAWMLKEEGGVVVVLSEHRNTFSTKSPRLFHLSTYTYPGTS